MSAGRAYTVTLSPRRSNEYHVSRGVPGAQTRARNNSNVNRTPSTSSVSFSVSMTNFISSPQTHQGPGTVPGPWSWFCWLSGLARGAPPANHAEGARRLLWQAGRALAARARGRGRDLGLGIARHERGAGGVVVAGAQMRVAHGHLDVGVPQVISDDAQGHARGHQTRRERVPQIVPVEIFHPGLGAGAVEPIARGVHLQRVRRAVAHFVAEFRALRLALGERVIGSDRDRRGGHVAGRR